MKLPDVIYVATRREDKTTWLEADRDTLMFDNGDKVGVYRLQDVKTKSIKHELE